MTSRIVLNSISRSARLSAPFSQAELYGLISRQTDWPPEKIDQAATEIDLRGYFDDDGQAHGLHWNTRRATLEIVLIGGLTR